MSLRICRGCILDIRMRVRSPLALLSPTHKAEGAYQTSACADDTLGTRASARTYPAHQALALAHMGLCRTNNNVRRRVFVCMWRVGGPRPICNAGRLPRWADTSWLPLRRIRRRVVSSYMTPKNPHLTYKRAHASCAHEQLRPKQPCTRQSHGRAKLRVCVFVCVSQTMPPAG